MAHFKLLLTIFNCYLTAVGLFGVPILAAVLTYAAFGLIKTRHAWKLIGLLIFVAMLFVPAGQYLLCVVGLAVTCVNNLFYLIYFSRSFRRRQDAPSLDPHNCPRVSILVPARNEEAVIEGTLRSIAALDYPADKLEVIIVDDCSTDNTSNICAQIGTLLIPGFKIVHNSTAKGKSKGLNDVVDSIDSEFFLVLDADHEIDSHFLAAGLTHFSSSKVACVQGINDIRNGRENLLCALIDMEYLGRYRGYYPGRDTAFYLGSGGIFRTVDFRAVGGFNPLTLTEDLEISFRIYDAGKVVLFDPRIATHELAVRNLRAFYWQRHRWMRGIWQTFGLHMRNLISPNRDFRKVRIQILHFGLECMALPVLLFMGLFFVFDWIGWMHFPAKLLLYMALSGILVTFSGGYVRGKRSYLLALKPLLLPYLLFYALIVSIGWVDNVLLNKPYLWRKTNRFSWSEHSMVLDITARLETRPEAEQVSD